ncbi:MAG: sulfotransferase [Rikenellaceae bacterium]
MARLDFNKLPINTLVGSSWGAFRKTTKGRKISKGYKLKYVLTVVICRILSVLTPIQNSIYRKKIEKKELTKDPLFIIGHWRSGTTFVHNVLAKDKQFGFTTTYHTVFPNIVLWGQSFFKGTMASIMPDKRPADNMELNVDLPQEEEFALSNMSSCNYYNFWFFPQNMMEYCSKYLTFKGASKEEKDEFKREFQKLVKISMANTGGERYLSKNPPHTARVKELLEIYPNAKFIYLMRNPYTVLESTRNFFYKTIKPLQLHAIEEAQFDKQIVEVYKEMYIKYEEDKGLIPEGNLIEMKFEEFEQNPSAATKRIYDVLSLGGYENAKGDIEKYLDTKKGYKKNAYKYAPEVIDTVEREWKFAVEGWNYGLEGAKE